jgi:hypothetical protein
VRVALFAFKSLGSIANNLRSVADAALLLMLYVGASSVLTLSARASGGASKTTSHLLCFSLHFPVASSITRFKVASSYRWSCLQPSCVNPAQVHSAVARALANIGARPSAIRKRLLEARPIRNTSSSDRPEAEWETRD